MPNPSMFFSWAESEGIAFKPNPAAAIDLNNLRVVSMSLTQHTTTR